MCFSIVLSIFILILCCQKASFYTVCVFLLYNKSIILFLRENKITCKLCFILFYI